MENGLGFSVSPLAASMGIKEDKDLFLKFINISFFYDFIRDEYLTFGPFSSISILSNKKIDYYQINFGLLFSICNIAGIFFNYDFLNVEVGYNYDSIRKGHGFYCQIGINFIMALFYLGLGHEKDINNYRNKNPAFDNFF